MHKRLRHAKMEFDQTLAGQVIVETLFENKKKMFLMGLDIQLHKIAQTLLQDYSCDTEEVEDEDEEDEEDDEANDSDTEIVCDDEDVYRNRRASAVKKSRDPFKNEETLDDETVQRAMREFFKRTHRG